MERALSGKELIRRSYYIIGVQKKWERAARSALIYSESLREDVRATSVGQGRHRRGVQGGVEKAMKGCPKGIEGVSKRHRRGIDGAT